VEGTEEACARYRILSEQIEKLVEEEDRSEVEEKKLKEEFNTQYHIMRGRREFNDARARHRSRPKADAFKTILRLVASTLEILDVNLDCYTAEQMSETVALPSLTDLTTHGGFPLKFSPSTDTPIQLLEPCHSLRHLHVAEMDWFTYPFHYIDQISFAPSITHLRFSGVQQDEYLLSDIGVALGLREPHKHPTPFPATMERVLIKPFLPPTPGSRCGNPYMEYSTRSPELRRDDNRFVLLQAQSTMPQVSDDEHDWLDLVNGGKGCWDESDVDQCDVDTEIDWGS